MLVDKHSLNFFESQRIISMVQSHVLIFLSPNSLEYSQFSTIYPVFTTPCLYIIINGIAMDILIHPFPSTEQDLYQRLSPLLQAKISSSQNSIQMASEQLTQDNVVELSRPVNVGSSTETDIKDKKDSTPKQEASTLKKDENTLKKEESTNLKKDEIIVKKNENSALKSTLNKEETSVKKQESLTIDPTPVKINIRKLKDTIVSKDSLKQRNISQKIKIRLPNGQVMFSEFKKNDTLESVKQWILKETDSKNKKLVLTTTTPKKTFEKSDYFKNLEELNVFGVTLYAEWEEEEQGLISEGISMITFLLGLIFNGLKSIFNRVKSLLSPDPVLETQIKPNRSYNGNSTSVE